MKIDRKFCKTFESLFFETSHMVCLHSVSYHYEQSMNSMVERVVRSSKLATHLSRNDHEMFMKPDKCVVYFSQYFMWFVKQVFCILCITPFRKERWFLYETSKEFRKCTFFFFSCIFFVNCEKENCVKRKKCVEVISSSFHSHIMAPKELIGIVV